jgi:fumarate hydratase class II
MMPVIAHNLFESMQVMIGAVKAFTEKCVLGVQANRAKAEGWLARNAIIVTALNPLIGYASGAALVKEALDSGRSIRELALIKASQDLLRHRDEDRPVRPDEIEAALRDIRKMTDGGILGGGAGSQ